MPRYSEERRNAVLSKLLPPLNMTVAEVSRVEGIGLQTLYNWRNKAKLQGRSVPGKNQLPNNDQQKLNLLLLLEQA